MQVSVYVSYSSDLNDEKYNEIYRGLNKTRQQKIDRNILVK